MTADTDKSAGQEPFPFPKSRPEEAAPALPASPPAGNASDAALDAKPPEELTEEELRLMADTMPGDGPGGD
jgi:hypothetical protein